MSKTVNWLGVHDAPKARIHTLTTMPKPAQESEPAPPPPAPKQSPVPVVPKQPPASPVLSEADQELCQQLRKRRLELARSQKVPAYVIFDDKTLTRLAMAKPHSVEEMLAVPGIGLARATKYAAHFLPILQGASRAR